MAKSSNPKIVTNPVKPVTNPVKITGKNSSNIPTFQAPLPPPPKKK